MCGRYFVTEQIWDDVQRDFPEVPAGFVRLPAGDIVPSMEAPALVAGGEAAGRLAGSSVSAAALLWGFPGFDGKRPVINARAETAADKPMFAESLRSRRCVLPAAGFYEWNKAKQKYTFTPEDASLIYLAGLWRPYGEERRFVILTREANESMQPVHDRMPLMIPWEAVRDWIADISAAKELLSAPLPQLSACTEYEQMSLFDEYDTQTGGGTNA